MKISRKERESDDIKKIKNYLLGLGFVCNSHPSSQNLIYSRSTDVIVIKNSKK